MSEKSKMKPYTTDQIKISLTPMDWLKLETWCTSAGGREVSGIGTVKFQNGIFHVTEVFLCAGGSESYTQIEPEHIIEVIKQGVDPSQIKLWWHRHPVGNGKPGTHNWSGTDEATIQEEPVGSSPALVEWSISMVRTPYGWVGRMDDYRKGHTLHCAVNQIFKPEEHALLKQIIGKRTTHQMAGGPQGVSDIGNLPPKAPGKLKSFSGDIADWLHRRRRPGKNTRDNNKLNANLANALGLSEEDYDDIVVAVQDNLPEVVAEQWHISVSDLYALDIISDLERLKAHNRMEWLDIHDMALEMGHICSEEVPKDLLEYVREHYDLDDDQMELL